MTDHGAPPVRVAVVTKGHRFESEPFFEVFDSMDHIVWEHVEHPEALALVDTDRFDTLVMYDMPGIEFTRSDPPTRTPAPPAGYPEAYAGMLERGQGLVFMHHAIAGWPAWEGYAELIGGRFHYQPATLGGVDYPDSGYLLDVTHTVEVLDREHPVCAGVPERFTLTDELYLFPMIDPDAHPLMRSTYDFVDEHFYSADLAIRGSRNDRTGWHHPPGSDLVAWTKRVGSSPIVYLQFGDGPATYRDATFRSILANAIRWTATERGPTR